MDIFEFQTEYLNSLEKSRELNEEVKIKYYKNIILNNLNEIFIELSLNINKHKYKTFTSILFYDFKDIYIDQICSMFLPYYVTFIQNVIDEFNGNLEDYNKIYCDLHNKIIISSNFYNWTPELNNEILTHKNTIFFNNKKIIPHIDKCFSNTNYKPIYELLLKMSGNLSNYLYKYISDILLHKLNSSPNIVDIIKEFQNHDLFNENNKKEILSRYTKNNIKYIFKEIVINENKDYMCFLNYITDSCLFIDNYKRILVKNALLPRNNKINVAYHNTIINKCNELNFVDSNHCKNILENSCSNIGFYSKQVEILIGTYGIWPLKSSYQSICKAFEPTKKIFDDFHKKENKKISWVYDEITAEIEFNNYLLIVPIFMVDYLLQFNENIEIDSDNSDIEKFLIKMEIIIKTKNRNKIIVNEKFKYKTNIVNLKSKAIKKKYKTKNIEHSTKNIIDIEYYIDSKIVKHMKNIKEINKQKLINQNDFKNIDETIIEKRLSSLQSRDFIEINKETITYVP